VSSRIEPAVSPTPAADAGRRSLRVAWASVVAIPFTTVGAFFLGDWLLSLQGYQSGSEVSAPLGAALLAGIPAVLLMLAPTIPAMIFGFRARARGVTSGIIPAAIGAVVAAGALLPNTLPLLLGIR
jgi:hypothetical protein